MEWSWGQSLLYYFFLYCNVSGLHVRTFKTETPHMQSEVKQNLLPPHSTACVHQVFMNKRDILSSLV